MQDTALWVNDAILAVTAVLVGCYVVATNKLVRTSQEQVRASQEQVESQSLPVLVIQEDGDQLKIVNIGNGPALGIEWRFKDKGTKPVFQNTDQPLGCLSYVEARQARNVVLKPSALVQWELHCLYRSASGRKYVSVTTFTANGTFESELHSERA